MKTKRIFCTLMAIFTLICSVSIPTFAAEPEIVQIDGKNVAFVSSFGRANHDGKAYVAFKTFNEAATKLGKDGGQIIFAGELKLSPFSDVATRGALEMTGSGAKGSSNTLNFEDTKNPVTEINLAGDMTLEFLRLRTNKEAFIYTNGFVFATGEDFDTYKDSTPSIAVGATTSEAKGIALGSGTYSVITAGAANGKNVGGNTKISLNSATVSNLVGGSYASGTMNGNAEISAKNISAEKLILGSDGGSVSGNVTVSVSNSEINNVVIGSASGSVSGNATLILADGTYDATFTKGKKAGGKTIVVLQDAKANIASDMADYVISIEGGTVNPVFNGKTVSGFEVRDSYGLSATSVTVDGASVSSANGIYSFAQGAHTVKVGSVLSTSINKNAKYVAGYPDGTFAPQNNITKAEAITLLSRVIIDENLIKGKITSDFADVADGAWYESYIGLFEALGYLDLLTDASKANISPDKYITRAEFTQLIYKVANPKEQKGSIKLGAVIDVPRTSPFRDAVSYATTNGIVTGYEDGTFRPDANITRAEVATMVNRLLGRTPTNVAGENNFTDIEGHWAKGQILAAAGLENVSWTASSKPTEYVLSGTTAKEYVTGLYDQSKNLDGAAIERGIATITNQLKYDILNTPYNTEELYGDKMTGTKYYISEKNGNDANDGLSPETAWKTMAPINATPFIKKGSTFLFERGGIYRGSLTLTSSQIIVGAYGDTSLPKPLLMQSKKNYADPNLWVETQWKNVWKCTDKLENVGVIGYDHDLFDYSENAYNEKFGDIMTRNIDGFMGPEDMTKDLSFYSVNDPEAPGVEVMDLYVYSIGGNPGERFSSIEIGENISIIGGSAEDVIVDNLAFKFSGAYGVGRCGTTKNRTVTNCVFSWIGGSLHSLSFRGSGNPCLYGNAVEIYGGCDGFYVKDNWMYQIYDTGVTHQYGETGPCIQKNVVYTGNLIEYCFWGIEYYNSIGNGSPNPKSQYTENVYIAYNVLNMNGYGWGCTTSNRVDEAYAICGVASYSPCREGLLTEYNIMNRCGGYLIALNNTAKETDDKNIYVQDMGRKLGVLKGPSKQTTLDAAHDIVELLGDLRPVVVIREK